MLLSEIAEEDSMSMISDKNLNNGKGRANGKAEKPSSRSQISNIAAVVTQSADPVPEAQVPMRQSQTNFKDIDKSNQYSSMLNAKSQLKTTQPKP